MKVADNTMQIGKEDKLIDQNLDIEKSLFFDAYDFENSCFCQVIAGYTKDGEIMWGKIK